MPKKKIPFNRFYVFPLFHLSIPIPTVFRMLKKNKEKISRSILFPNSLDLTYTLKSGPSRGTTTRSDIDRITRKQFEETAKPIT